MYRDLLKETKELCSVYSIKPARSRGQNFLIDENYYDSVIKSAKLTKNDTVLEIGPGLGFLTKKLAEKAGKVIAIELDDKLAGYLQSAKDTQKLKNIEIINMDVLDFNPNILGSNYKIVANLPYNITSIFLRKFLSVENKPVSLTLMLQKEVAERIIASPPKLSILAISIQFYANSRIVKYVPKQAFLPEPEVESAIIQIDIYESNKIPAWKKKLGQGKDRNFFRIVKFGFSQKRKMLKNNLASGFRISQAEAVKRLESIGLDSKIRAQELSLDDWVEALGAFEDIVV